MKAQIKTYPEINPGDKVRLPIIHKVAKGFKQQWGDDLYSVQKVYHNGVYVVNNALYPRGNSIS